MAHTWGAIVNPPTVRIMTLLVINTTPHVNYNPETGIGQTWLMFHSMPGQAMAHKKKKMHYIILVHKIVVRFPDRDRKTNIKGINSTNHSMIKQCDKPITIPSNYLQLQEKPETSRPQRGFEPSPLRCRLMPAALKRLMIIRIGMNVFDHRTFSALPGSQKSEFESSCSPKFFWSFSLLVSSAEKLR